MTRANTNNILRPEFSTLEGDDSKIEKASGMGYEGPRM